MNQEMSQVNKIHFENSMILFLFVPYVSILCSCSNLTEADAFQGIHKFIHLTVTS